MTAEKLQGAIARLAELFEYGVLQADVAPVEFLDDVSDEIRRLRIRNGALGSLLTEWVEWEANPDGAPDSGYWAKAQDIAERSRELLEVYEK